MKTVFSLNGVEYNVSVISLKRTAAILDGDQAGRTQNARMHRDIKGTFYNYAITIDVKSLNASEYDKLYQTLTAPVNSHQCVFPYGQGTLRFEAYVANAEDQLISNKKIAFKRVQEPFLNAIFAVCMKLFVTVTTSYSKIACNESSYL